MASQTVLETEASTELLLEGYRFTFEEWPLITGILTMNNRRVGDI